MNMEFRALRVDATHRGVASEMYTLTRTKGMQLYRLDWFIFNGDGDWDSDRDDIGIEFWAHDDATALSTLRTNLRNFNAHGLNSYASDDGLHNKDIYSWVQAVAPDYLDLSQYSSVMAVLEAGDHIVYVTRKMSDLFDSIESHGLMADLMGTNYG